MPAYPYPPMHFTVITNVVTHDRFTDRSEVKICHTRARAHTHTHTHSLSLSLSVPPSLSAYRVRVTGQVKGEFSVGDVPHFECGVGTGGAQHPGVGRPAQLIHALHVPTQRGNEPAQSRVSWLSSSRLSYIMVCQ